jgi:hypothetical protein
MVVTWRAATSGFTVTKRRSPRKTRHEITFFDLLCEKGRLAKKPARAGTTTSPERRSSQSGSGPDDRGPPCVLGYHATQDLRRRNRSAFSFIGQLRRLLFWKRHRVKASDIDMVYLMGYGPIYRGGP